MIVDETVEQYAQQHTTPERGELAAVAATTRAETQIPQMMVGPLEGGFLRMLVHMLRPTTVLEIGGFTGYSALSMAPALPEGGRIITCELDPRHAELCRKHFAASEWGDRITLEEGPAIDTVERLAGPFDMVFIDADKQGYAAYYDAVLPKLSEGGVIAVDNVLWSGSVVGDSDDPDTQALQAFNRKVADDPRVEQVMVTIRDGVTLIRRVA